MEEKILKILELVQTKEDGTVEFSEESKKLIHEVAEECRKLPIYQKNKEKENTYKDGMTAKQVYVDMCFRIVNAPTHIHMMMAPKLMLPVIDDLLQEELKENGGERMSIIRNRLYQFKQELLSNKDRAWYSHTNLLTAVDLLIADLDNLDESDWIRVNDEMPVERDSMFAKFKGTNTWKTGMFEKVSRNVLVTVEYDDGKRHTEVAHTVDGRWKLEMRILRIRNAKVIAWKEMPEPDKRIFYSDNIEMLSRNL